jgi:DNA-directed RNA polymerase sigma subunit (sigma70/sigma32)
VTRERVRQIEARLVARLSEHLKQHLIDFEFYASPRD